MDVRDKRVIKKHNSGVIVRWSAERGDVFESEMRNSIATRSGGEKEIRRQPKRSPKKREERKKNKLQVRMSILLREPDQGCEVISRQLTATLRKNGKEGSWRAETSTELQTQTITKTECEKRKGGMKSRRKPQGDSLTFIVDRGKRALSFNTSSCPTCFR